jgi:hypothetical protein
MARLYANENFPLPVVIELRRLGHDVLTSYESGLSGQAVPDDAVLSFAAAESRILLTLNRRHFIRLHLDRPEHSGIIVCTIDPNSVALAQRIHETLEANPPLLSQLVRINRPA